MRLRTFTSATSFFDAVGRTLLAREAENSLLLGIALRLADGHGYGDETPFLACVEEEGQLPVIALCTPPHNLVLCADAARTHAIAPIVEHLAATGTALPGAHGRDDVVDAFAVLWEAKTGAATHVGMEQRLYELTEVEKPGGVPGIPRWAEKEDAELLTAWADAFINEAVPGEPKPDVRAMVDGAIIARSLLVWDNHGAVSMCARSRPTPRGASVNLVYTPAAQRGHGYASACVAELSQRILDSGKEFCTLFTDLSNSTSNAIYQRVGYRPLCDFREIRFSAPD